MADWDQPTVATAADTTLDDLKERDVDAATLFASVPSHTPTNAIRWNRSSDAFEEYDGAAWNALNLIYNLPGSIITSGVIALARGGTGVDLSASGGSGKVLAQDASHVISARILAAADIPNLPTAVITTGVFGSSFLGSGGDASGTHFLADDSTFKRVNASFSVSASGTISITIPSLDLNTDKGYEFYLRTTSTLVAAAELRAKINATGAGQDTTFGLASDHFAGPVNYESTAEDYMHLSMGFTHTIYMMNVSLRLMNSRPHLAWTGFSYDAVGGKAVYSGYGSRNNTTNVTSLVFQLSTSTCDWEVWYRIIG